MNIKSLKLIYFSPTKTTQSVVNSIANGIETENVSCVDLTPVNSIDKELACCDDDLTIIGAPVYSGRIPEQAVARLQQVKGNNKLAVVVVVYGNRAYEDALLELQDIAVAQGFKVIAAAAFIGEHSFDCEFTTIASERPDMTDTEKAKQFGLSIQNKIAQVKIFDDIDTLLVPGNFPYKERKPASKMAPVVDQSLCILCGDCADACPTGAIVVQDDVVTDHDACIFCSACIKTCPTGAREWENSWIDQVREKLNNNCQQRKEPEVYL